MLFIGKKIFEIYEIGSFLMEYLIIVENYK